MEWVVTFINAAILAAACDPYGLNRKSKHKHVVQIVKFAEYNQQDPYELLAIALTESSLKPKAYSRTRGRRFCFQPKDDYKDSRQFTAH